jgi:hypothetical protein
MVTTTAATDRLIVSSMDDDAVKMTLRLPKQMHGPLLERAERHFRSLHGEILATLHDALEADRRKAAEREPAERQ